MYSNTPTQPRSAEQTAISIALMLSRSAKNRARISENTFRQCAGCPLDVTARRTTFFFEVQQRLFALGVVLVESVSGYGLCYRYMLHTDTLACFQEQHAQELQRLQQTPIYRPQYKLSEIEMFVRVYWNEEEEI